MVESCTMLNGFDFKWHSKTEQPNHSKSDQIAFSLDSYLLVPFLMVGTISIAVTMIPIILIPNHPKLEHQNICISNGYSSPHCSLLYRCPIFVPPSESMSSTLIVECTDVLKQVANTKKLRCKTNKNFRYQATT